MTQNRSHAVMAQRVEAHEIITTAEARARGLKWYFTGVPCPKGHLAKRTLSNRECRGCSTEKLRCRRAEQPERFRVKERKAYHRNAEKKRASSRASRARHWSKRIEYDRKRYHQNPKRMALQKEQALRWQRENRGKRNVITASRRAWVKRATPPWLSQDQKAEIKALYLMASSMGLHVPWNLQILSAVENTRKSNVIPCA